MQIDLSEFVDKDATIQEEGSDLEVEEANFTFRISDDDDDLFDDIDSHSNHRNKSKTKGKSSNSNSNISDSDDDLESLNKNENNELISMFAQSNSKGQNKERERSFLSTTNDKIAHYQGIRERRFAKKRRRNGEDPFIQEYDKWWQYINNSNDLESKQNEQQRKDQIRKRRRLNVEFYVFNILILAHFFWCFCLLFIFCFVHSAILFLFL